MMTEKLLESTKTDLPKIKLALESDLKKAAEEALATFIKKYPPQKQLVPAGAEKFLKTYLIP